MIVHATKRVLTRRVPRYDSPPPANSHGVPINGHSLISEEDENYAYVLGLLMRKRQSYPCKTKGGPGRNMYSLGAHLGTERTFFVAFHLHINSKTK